jgi:hypothetical protein
MIDNFALGLRVEKNSNLKMSQQIWSLSCKAFYFYFATPRDAPQMEQGCKV